MFENVKDYIHVEKGVIPRNICDFTIDDHIHSLFDGDNKGIPVISFVGNLNDNYEGADIFFWDDYVVELGAGDILMFPSLFMYPHGVTEATKGRRYSFVSWAW